LTPRSFFQVWTGLVHALKALVVGLGVLIVGGICLLAYGLYMKASDPDFSLFRDGAGTAVPAMRFGRLGLDLPKGCSIVEMRPDGERLFLHIGPPVKSCERIIVIDAIDGTVLGTVETGP
jgi:hypothetical protein